MLNGRAFAAMVIRFRWAIAALACAALGLAGWALRGLTINPDVADYFPASDTAVVRFRHVGAEYGATATAVVALETADAFTLPALATVRDLTSGFAALDGVASVASLTNVLDVREADGAIEVSRLVDPLALPSAPDSLEALRRRALEEPLIRGRLVSDDCRTTLIVCRLADSADQVAVADSIRAVVARAAVAGTVYYAGFPFQMQLISQVVVRDLKRLVPIASAVVVLALLAGFRSIAGVVVPLVTVLASVVLTLGTMAALRIPLTVISDAIPVILIAVGSAYGIHVVNRLRESDMRDDSQAAGALASVALPVILAGVTTIAGFLSFVFGSYLTLIREFGVFSALGVACALLVALTLAPALMRIWPGRFRAAASREPGRAEARVLAAAGRLVVRHHRWVLALGVCAALAAGAGIPRIERKASILDYFKPGADIRQSEALLEKRFGGTIPLAVVVEGDMDEPAVLGSMSRLARRLAALPELHSVQSAVDLLEEMNELMGEGRKVPGSREKAANLWFMLEGQEALAQLVRPDHGEAVIHATIGRLNTRSVRRLVREIESCLDSARAEGLTVYQSGLHVIYRNLDQSIVTTLAGSLALSVALIFGCLWAMLRSARLAALGLIPVGLALAANFGVMGWLGVPLDVITVLIGSVSVGIGVDYAIHFCGRYRQETLAGAATEEAIGATLRSAGRAIAINAVTVMAGFAVLTQAEIVPLQQFGALAAVTMAASGLGALTVLPAALAWMARHGRDR